MRPGPPPPPRRPRRSLGPTPRYYSVPRWGLVDQIAAPEAEASGERKSASPRTVQITLLIAAAVFALAAAAHILRYLLMLINRTTLLPPFVAIGSLISGVLASLAAIVAVLAVAVVLTLWLISRRATAFARHRQADPRPEWALWLGCVVPVVNWFFAPLFVLELAQAEGCRERQSRPIAMWAIAWAVASLICAWATWTSFHANEPQAVADNTVTVIIAYLAGLAVVLLMWRVVTGFLDRPVERPLHRRWVIASGEAVPAVLEPSSATEVGDVDELGVIDDEAEQAGDPTDARDREPVA